MLFFEEVFKTGLLRKFLTEGEFEFILKKSRDKTCDGKSRYVEKHVVTVMFVS